MTAASVLATTLGCSSSGSGGGVARDAGIETGVDAGGGSGGDGGGGRDGGGAGTAPRHLTGLPTGDWIESLAFSPDGATLWAASEQQIGGSTGETLSWTVASGAAGASVPGPAWSVATAPSGSNVAVGGATTGVLTPATGGAQMTELTLPGASGAVAYSHDGKWIAAAAPATGEVLVFSTADGSVVAKVAHPVVTNERIWRVTFSADDRMLATCSGQNGLGSPHGSTYVWSTSGFTQLTQIPCTTFDAAFSPDGTQLALACWVDAKVFSTKDWSTTRAIQLPGSLNAMGVAISPDGSRLAIGVFQGGIDVYAMKDGSLAAALTDGANTPTVKGIAFSPDGKRLAGGGWDDAIVRVWTGGF